jgi:hypothetical protein
MGGNEYAVEDLLGFQLLARRGREYRCLHAECAAGLAALAMTPQSRARMAVNGAIPAMGQLLQLYTAATTNADAGSGMRSARAVSAVQFIMACLRNLTAAAATHVPMCTHCLPGIAAVAATAKSGSSSTAVHDTAVAAAALALQVLSNLSRSRVQGVRLAIYKVQLRQQGSGKQQQLLNARKQHQQPQTDDEVSLSIEAILQRVRSASSSSSSIATMCLSDSELLLDEGSCDNVAAVTGAAATAHSCLDTTAIQKRLRTTPVHLWGALAQQLEVELAEHTDTAIVRPHSSSSSKRLPQHSSSSSSGGSGALMELCATLSRPSVTSAAPRQWQLRAVQTSLGERAMTAALPLAVRLEHERVTRRCNGRTGNGRTNGRVAGRVSGSRGKSSSINGTMTAAAAAAVAAAETESPDGADVKDDTQAASAPVLNIIENGGSSTSTSVGIHGMQRRSEDDCLLADRRPATAPASSTAHSTLLASISDGHIRVVLGSAAADPQHTATCAATMNSLTTSTAAGANDSGATVPQSVSVLATQRLMQDSVLQATHLHTAQTATAASTHSGSPLKAYPGTNNPDPWSPSLLYRYTHDPVTAICPHEKLVLDPTLSQSKFGFGTKTKHQQHHSTADVSASHSVDSYTSAMFRESDAAEQRRAAATVRLSRFEHTAGARICEASHTEHVQGLDGRVYHHHCSTDLLSFPPGHPGAYPITAAPQTLRYMQLPLPPPQRALKPAAGGLQGGSSTSSSGSSSGGSGSGAGTSEELLLAAGGAQPGDAVPDAPQCTAHSMAEVQRWQVNTCISV